jgi:hypothetical protein
MMDRHLVLIAPHSNRTNHATTSVHNWYYLFPSSSVNGVCLAPCQSLLAVDCRNRPAVQAVQESPRYDVTAHIFCHGVAQCPCLIIHVQGIITENSGISSSLLPSLSHPSIADLDLSQPWQNETRHAQWILLCSTAFWARCTYTRPTGTAHPSSSIKQAALTDDIFLFFPTKTLVRKWPKANPLGLSVPSS